MALKAVERAVSALLDATAMGLTIADLKEMLPEVPIQQISHACNDLFQRWHLQRLVMRDSHGKEFFVYFSMHLKTSCPLTLEQNDDREDPEMKRRIKAFLRY